MSRARDLSKFANNQAISVDSSLNVGINSSSPDAKLDVVGVVSATEFYGDGSNLTGVSSPGLGTALSDDTTSPLNSIYFTNANLSVASTITVNPPASASAAFTQYANIVLQNDADLIVADGDTFIPDILGIGTGVEEPGTLAGGAGKLRVDNITDKAGTGSPNFPNGVVFTGVTTAGSQISLLNGGSQYGFLKESGSGNTELGGTTDLKLSTDGTERVRVTSSGKVGINTTGPNATLTVGPVDTPGFNRGSVAIKALTDGNSLPTNIYLEEESGPEGYLLSIDSNGDLNFHNSGAAAPTVTFSDDDKVGIGTAAPQEKLHVSGGNIKLDDGYGIDFSHVASPVNSAVTSNSLLDDYEEGSWTPTLPSGGSYGIQRAVYCKIGRMVHCYTYGSMSGIPNNNDGFYIGGLPFTSASSNYYPSGSLGYTGSFNYADRVPLVMNNNTYIYFHTLAGSGTIQKNSSAAGSWPIVISIWYYT
jgi:hypothetical protein